MENDMETTGIMDKAQDAVKVETMPEFKSFVEETKDTPFYPELELVKDAREYFGAPLIIWDATVRDWSGEYGETKYCLLKVSILDKEKWQDCFLLRLGGIAIVDQIRKAIARKKLPAARGMRILISEMASAKTGNYYPRIMEC